MDKLRKIICKLCRGSGLLSKLTEHKCPRCKGKGYIKK